MKVAEEIMQKLSLHRTSIEPGRVIIKENLSRAQRRLLNRKLKRYDMELITDEDSIVVDKIKNAIIGLYYYSEDMEKIKISDYIQKELGSNYADLAKVFKSKEGKSIMIYVELVRMEKAKTLMKDEKLNVSQTADKLEYCCIAQFSKQFKKFTGYSPTHFMKRRCPKRCPLERL
jgi:YesN/AraC family two-component response regulator